LIIIFLKRKGTKKNCNWPPAPPL